MFRWNRTRTAADPAQAQADQPLPEPGAEHLAKLLNKCETVVRHQPGDILVLGCRDELMDAAEAEALETLFQMAGVQYGAVVLLGPGMTIGNLDMEDLIDAGLRANQSESVNTEISHADAPISTDVKCPRCRRPVELPVLVSIADDGEWMTGRARVDEFLLSNHAKTCSGVSVVH